MEIFQDLQYFLVTYLLQNIIKNFSGSLCKILYFYVVVVVGVIELEKRNKQKKSGGNLKAKVKKN